MVTGLAAASLPVGGIGGMVTGLAAASLPVGGIGGMVTGLAAASLPVGGIGGMVTGLAAASLPVGGIGGMVTGLAAETLIETGETPAGLANAILTQVARIAGAKAKQIFLGVNVTKAPQCTTLVDE
jgi:hypothetical protein